MRRARRHRLHYDRVFILGLFVTLGMFTTGCVIGGYHELEAGSNSGVDWGSVHVRTTYAVAHKVADEIAWTVRDRRTCPTPTQVGHPIDPWGHAYDIACADTLVVMSAGADGRFGTGDDVVSR
jgi:hypothetical protein